MARSENYRKYTFRDRSGGIVDSRVTEVAHNLLVIGHTAFVLPWKDPCVHLHHRSDECYLLLHGELELLIDGLVLDLQPGELLMVRPQIAHAVIGGQGVSEYFGFRAPTVDELKFWTYEVVVKGRMLLQIEDELVAVDVGEILEVSPAPKCQVRQHEAPYEGLSIRVPVTSVIP